MKTESQLMTMKSQSLYHRGQIYSQRLKTKRIQTEVSYKYSYLEQTEAQNAKSVTLENG